MKIHPSLHHFFLFSILILVFNSCSGNNAEQKSKVHPDTIIKESPEPPFNEAIIGISQDSLSTYLKMAKEVVANKKTRRPFKHLRYTKVIAYVYQGFVG